MIARAPATDRNIVMLRVAGLSILVLGLALLASCRGPRHGTAPDDATSPRDLSPAAAAAAAARDVRDGRAVIYVAGTIALYEPGIDEVNRGWVASLTPVVRPTHGMHGTARGGGNPLRRRI